MKEDTEKQKKMFINKDDYEDLIQGLKYVQEVRELNEKHDGISKFVPASKEHLFDELDNIEQITAKMTLDQMSSKTTSRIPTSHACVVSFQQPLL